MKVYFFKAGKPARFLLAAAAILVVLLLADLSLKGLGTSNTLAGEDKTPIYSVDTDRKVAAITFDCAWGADDIPNILDVLDKAGIKATFFIVGQWAEKYPDKVRMIAQYGHDIGNHSYSHLRMGSMDRDRAISEIQLCGSKLSGLTQSKTELFRPPYGDYSAGLVSAASSLGYYSIQWNVDSLDWKPDISKSEIMSRISNKIRPGSIILFHNDTTHTAQLLPDIIDTLRSRGYEFEPVSKMILRDNYIIDFDGCQKKK